MDTERPNKIVNSKGIRGRGLRLTTPGRSWKFTLKK